jgi:hypothetical protein
MGPQYPKTTQRAAGSSWQFLTHKARLTPNVMFLAAVVHCLLLLNRELKKFLHPSGLVEDYKNIP